MLEKALHFSYNSAFEAKISGSLSNCARARIDARVYSIIESNLIVEKFMFMRHLWWHVMPAIFFQALQTVRKPFIPSPPDVMILFPIKLKLLLRHSLYDDPSMKLLRDSAGCLHGIRHRKSQKCSIRAKLKTNTSRYSSSGVILSNAFPSNLALVSRKPRMRT